MQYIHDNRPQNRRPLGLGWKGVFFGVLVVALSLVVSVAAVDLVTSIVL